MSPSNRATAATTTPTLATVADDLSALLESFPKEHPGLLVTATAARLSHLPPVLTPADVADLLHVDVKVVYQAVSELDLPMRPVGRRKCLRGLTLPILLWLANHWPLPSAAADPEGEGPVASDTKRKRR